MNTFLLLQRRSKNNILNLEDSKIQNTCMVPHAVPAMYRIYTTLQQNLHGSVAFLLMIYHRMIN